MVTRDEARRRVFDHINRVCRVRDDYLDIVDALTVERPRGWFMMFDCHKFIQTRDPAHAQLVGNVPLFVDRATGSLNEVPWKGSLEASIQAYEADHQP